MAKQAVKKTLAAKAVAPALPGKTRGRKPAVKVFYVLSKRSKMFQWQPVELFPTRELAVTYRNLYQSVHPYSIEMFKITSVTLKDRQPNPNDVIVIP